MQYGKTERGFELVKFTDTDGQPCELQASSAIDSDHPEGFDRPGTSFVWLGPKRYRMHLDRDTAEELVARLLGWLDCGSFRLPDDEPAGQAAGN